MLGEQLREVARAADTIARPADYHSKLDEAEQAVEALRQLLRNAGPADGIDESFRRVGRSCTECHRRYRNQ